MSVEKLFPPEQPPDNDMPLWRYMKLSTFLMLLGGKAFFPSVATLQRDDKLEGDLIPEPEWLMSRLGDLCRPKMGQLLEWLESRADGSERSFRQLNRDDGHLQTDILCMLYIRQLAKRRAVWCWFYDLHESAGMWSVYGSGGIAIRTRLSKLVSALPENMRFLIASITYANRSRQSALSYFNPEAMRNQNLVHRPHLIKGIEYRDEREVRVTTTCLEEESGRLVGGIRPVQLIEEVVISPLLPFEEAEAVQNHIEQGPWADAKPYIHRSSILGRIAEAQESMARVTGLVRAAHIPDEEPNLPPPFDQL